MIVGEDLIGVLIAALVAFSGKDFPLSLVSDSFADNGAVGHGRLRSHHPGDVSVGGAPARAASEGALFASQFWVLWCP
jgi:hypothetical protein